MRLDTRAHPLTHWGYPQQGQARKHHAVKVATAPGAGEDDPMSEGAGQRRGVKYPNQGVGTQPSHRKQDREIRARASARAGTGRLPQAIWKHSSTQAYSESESAV